MKNDSLLRFKTAGYSAKEELSVDPRPSSCGNITDGVVFAHDGDGGWVLSFVDLEAIYLAAKANR